MNTPAPHRVKFDVGVAISQPFRLPGGRNFLIRLILWTTALLLLVYFFFGRALIAGYFEAIQNFVALGDTEDPEAVIAAMAPLMKASGSVFLLMICSWVVMAMSETAFHKHIFRGTDFGVFPLRFGSDEARVMLAQFVVWIILYGVFMVSYLVIILLGAVMAAMSGAGGGGGAAAGLFGLLVLLGFFLMIAMCVIAFIRLAPAAALSVRDGAVRTVEGWKITRGRVGPLFGSYLIVGVVGYFAIFIVSMVGAILTFSNISGLDALPDDDPAAALEALAQAIDTPQIMIPLVLSVMAYVAVVTLWQVSFWGIANYAAQLDSAESKISGGET